MTFYFLGLDGACVADIRSVQERVELPNFAKIIDKGSMSPLTSVYPYVTAPGWTSMFSGVNPGKHGVFDMYEIRGEELRPANMRGSPAPFVWDYLSWAGKRVLVAGVPFCHPAPSE